MKLFVRNKIEMFTQKTETCNNRENRQPASHDIKHEKGYLQCIARFVDPGKIDIVNSIVGFSIISLFHFFSPFISFFRMFVCKRNI